MIAELLLLASGEVTAEQAMHNAERLTSVAESCRADSAAGADVITVCGRREVERSRFRLPETVHSRGSRAAEKDDAAAERARLAGGPPVGAGGHNCTAIGPGGAAGCSGGVPVLAPVMKLLEKAGIIAEVPAIVAEERPPE